MNILIIKNPFSSQPHGGGERHTMQVANFWRARGHRVYFATTCPYLSQLARAAQFPVDNITWAGREAVSEGALLQFIFSWPLIKRRYEDFLVRQKRDRDINMLYILSWNEKFLLGPMAQRLGMQMVFVEHRLLENFIRLNPFRGWYVKNCQRARVVAVSEAVKRGVVEFGVPAEQVQVIYNGIDLAEFRLPLKSRRENQGLVVGTISRLSADKGLDLLIAAVKRLGLKFPGLKVEIVGAGPERKKLERLTYNQGRPLPVCLRGGLGRAAIVEFLQNLDVFTLTPIHGESFGLVLAEAGAAGKPSVVTDVGGVAEVVKDGETGIVVPPGDVGALAEAIRRLLGNVDLRKRMGRAARRRVERMFTLDKMLNRYEQLLRNV